MSQITEEEYLMACLLPVADESGLLSPSGSALSLFFYFPESLLLGVFCGLVAYLLSQGKWKLFPKPGSQSPAKVDQNTVHFEVPGGFPGKVILFQPFSKWIFRFLIMHLQKHALKCVPKFKRLSWMGYVRHPKINI